MFNSNQATEKAEKDEGSKCFTKFPLLKVFLCILISEVVRTLIQLTSE